MPNITVTETWPETLPLPFIEFEGIVKDTTLRSPLQEAHIQKRSPSETTYPALNVRWVLESAQWGVFREYFNDDLDMGVSAFSIDLRFPMRSELTNWMVRFDGGYTGKHTEEVWTVSAKLELMAPTELPDPAYPFGVAGFFVQPENSGEPEELFTTVDNEDFLVLE